MVQYFRVAVKTALLVIIVFSCWYIAPKTTDHSSAAGYVAEDQSYEDAAAQPSTKEKLSGMEMPEERLRRRSADVGEGKSATPLAHKVEVVIDEVKQGDWYKRLVQQKKSGVDYDMRVAIFAFFIIGSVVGGVMIVILAVGDLKTLLDSDFFLNFIGLTVIVLAVSMFGLLGIFEAKDLMTIFSAIAGYILGQGVSRKVVIYPQSQSRVPNIPGPEGNGLTP